MKVDRRPGHGPWGDCHVWLGKRQSNGYGNFKVEGTYRLAHRVALELAGMALSEETHHRCEVPYCVNVNHLEPVTTRKHLNKEHSARPGRRRYRTSRTYALGERLDEIDDKIVKTFHSRG